MPLYSNSLSAIATIPSLIMSKVFAACFFSSINFILPHILFGSDDNHLVFDSLRDVAMTAGDLSNLSLILFYGRVLPSKYISFAKSNIFFCPII